MDTQPQRQDAHDPDDDRTVAAWLASEAFTHFMTLTFDAAVRQAMDEPARTNWSDRQAG